MYNSSLRIVKDEAEAEDIMQEAFLSAFKNIKKYKGEVSFGAWLKRIVVNRSLDYLKKKKLDFLRLDNEIYKLSEEEDDDVNFEFSEENVKMITKAIELLPKGYGIILNLYLIEGYDHEEIGQILNISSSTSRSQYLRAKKKLIQIVSHQKKQIL